MKLLMFLRNINISMTFQIKQDFGNNCGGWIYFESDSCDIEWLKKLAIQAMIDDWKKSNEPPHLGFIKIKSPRPTITVKQYENGSVAKDGISFKTKWK